MKRIILPLSLILLLAGTAIAQQTYDPSQPKEEIQLESFEKCNNWARHYCQTGDHEILVNRGLLQWKRQGVQITTKRIRVLSQKVRQNLRLKRKKAAKKQQ